MSEAPALPGRSASECWERWTFFVCPMRYGRRGSPWDKNTATRQLPPQTWGKLPGQSLSLSPVKPMRRVSPWAGQNSRQLPPQPQAKTLRRVSPWDGSARQLPLQTRPPHNPSETLRRMADDLAHHVDGLRQSISRLSEMRPVQAPRYSPSLNPQLPSASMDSSLDAAPWSPPPPQLSSFDHLLADASLPLPPPAESPYAFAPSELEDLFEPALDDGVVPFCWTLEVRRTTNLHIQLRESTRAPPCSPFSCCFKLLQVGIPAEIVLKITCTTTPRGGFRLFLREIAFTRKKTTTVRHTQLAITGLGPAART